MESNEISSLIDTVKTIAIEAGKEILKVYGDENGLGIQLKDDESPLTIADQRANQLICDGLAKLDSSIPIISEENKEIPYAARKDFEYFWMVDPLDGTKEFIKRNGEFTVNIALIHKNESVAGVVYVPVTEELYYAVKGEGAQVDVNGENRKLKTNAFEDTDAGLKVVCSRSHLNEETTKFLDALNAPETVAKGSSLKFLIIAEGNADLYPRLAPTMEWDTAAAQIILEEAGGRVFKAEDQSPVRYNKEILLNPHFIAKGC